MLGIRLDSLLGLEQVRSLAVHRRGVQVVRRGFGLRMRRQIFESGPHRGSTSASVLAASHVGSAAVFAVTRTVVRSSLSRSAS
jgi:hypothetical protein